MARMAPVMSPVTPLFGRSAFWMQALTRASTPRSVEPAQGSRAREEYAMPLSAAAVSYAFVFERATERLLRVEPDPPTGAAPPFFASIVSNPLAPYEKTFQFGFSTASSLDGLTLDIAELTSVAPDAWHAGFADSWSNAKGHVTLSGTGVAPRIASWHISAEPGPGDSFSFFWENRSEPEPIDPAQWPWTDVQNPQVLPAAHYGLNYSEPAYRVFALAPGRWSCFADGSPLPEPPSV
jgi:hypothetical protein